MNRNLGTVHMDLDQRKAVILPYEMSTMCGKERSGSLKVTSKDVSILHKNTPFKNPGIIFCDLPEVLGYATGRTLNLEGYMRSLRYTHFFALLRVTFPPNQMSTVMLTMWPGFHIL